MPTAEELYQEINWNLTCAARRLQELTVMYNDVLTERDALKRQLVKNNAGSDADIDNRIGEPSGNGLEVQESDS